MEGPIDYLDSPMDPEEDAYPCKGCGQVSQNIFYALNKRCAWD